MREGPTIQDLKELADLFERSPLTFATPSPEEVECNRQTIHAALRRLRQFRRLSRKRRKGRRGEKSRNWWVYLVGTPGISVLVRDLEGMLNWAESPET